MNSYEVHSSNDLPNEASSLDRIERRRQRQRAYYANMSAGKKKEVLQCKKEARAKRKAMTIEMEDAQIGKVNTLSTK